MKIKTKSQLEKYLAEVVTTAVESALINESSEKEIQDKTAEEIKSLAVDDIVSDKPLKEEPVVKQSAKISQAATSTQVSDPKITFSMIKDKLNVIRSGRSLRDDDIRYELKEFFKKLKETEQEALYVFLDSIAKIITAGLPSEEVQEPSDPPHGLDVEKTADSEPHTEKPTKKVNADTHQPSVNVKKVTHTKVKPPIQVK